MCVGECFGEGECGSKLVQGSLKLTETFSHTLSTLHVVGANKCSGVFLLVVLVHSNTNNNPPVHFAAL